MLVIEHEYWGTSVLMVGVWAAWLKVLFQVLASDVFLVSSSISSCSPLGWWKSSCHTLGFSPRTFFVFFLDGLMSRPELHKGNRTSRVQLTFDYRSLLTQADTELRPKVDWALCHHSEAQCEVDSQSEYADSKTMPPFLTLSPSNHPEPLSVQFLEAGRQWIGTGLL